MSKSISVANTGDTSIQCTQSPFLRNNTWDDLSAHQKLGQRLLYQYSQQLHRNLPTQLTSLFLVFSSAFELHRPLSVKVRKTQQWAPRRAPETIYTSWIHSGFIFQLWPQTSLCTCTLMFISLLQPNLLQGRLWKSKKTYTVQLFSGSYSRSFKTKYCGSSLDILIRLLRNLGWGVQHQIMDLQHMCKAACVHLSPGECGWPTWRAMFFRKTAAGRTKLNKDTPLSHSCSGSII